jgi:hypothetical protein
MEMKKLVANLITGEFEIQEIPELTARQKSRVRRYVQSQQAQDSQAAHRKALREGRF